MATCRYRHSSQRCSGINYLALALALLFTGAETTTRFTVERILKETAWNKAKAARLLGISRTQLYGRRRYGLEAPGCDGAFT